MYDAYWLKKANLEETQPEIASALKYGSAATQKEMAMHDWIVQVIDKNMPPTRVEDEETRNFCKHRHEFSYKQLCLVMHLVGELVQIKRSRLPRKSRARRELSCMMA